MDNNSSPKTNEERKLGRVIVMVATKPWDNRLAHSRQLLLAMRERLLRSEAAGNS